MVSLLFKKPPEAPVHMTEEALEDLLIKDFIDSVLREELKKIAEEWYLKPSRDIETLRYRQEVFADLFSMPSLRKSLELFVDGLYRVERLLDLSKNLHYEDNKKGWFLEASLEYCRTLEELDYSLSYLELRSEALQLFRRYLDSYVRSHEFQVLKTDADLVRQKLAKVRLVVIVEPGQFTVTAAGEEAEYAAEVERVFEKFSRSYHGRTQSFDVRKPTGMNHIEAKIVEFARKLYPDAFEALDNFSRKHENFLRPELQIFRNELIFYLSYLDFIEPLREQGLAFCIPKFKLHGRSERVEAMFELMLAHRRRGTNVVTNDIEIDENERILIVTGPNQGGKTTYARAYAFLHYLAALGLPVPGTNAELFLPDGIYTHFEREERMEDQLSKLESEILLLKKNLSYITHESLFVLNEIFSSTALKDSIELSKMLQQELLNRGCTVIWVTFVDELAQIEDKRVVSLVALVSRDEPTVRTFKIARKSPEGRAYAISLAEKYGLTYERIKKTVEGGE